MVQNIIQYFSQVTDILKGAGNYFYFQKSNSFSDENITTSNTSDYSLNQQLRYLGNKTSVEFKGSCLKQDKITYIHGKK